MFNIYRRQFIISSCTAWHPSDAKEVSFCHYAAGLAFGLLPGAASSWRPKISPVKHISLLSNEIRDYDYTWAHDLSAIYYNPFVVPLIAA